MIVKVAFYFKRDQIMPVVQGLLGIDFEYQIRDRINIYKDVSVIIVHESIAESVDYHLQFLKESGNEVDLLERDEISTSMEEL